MHAPAPPLIPAELLLTAYRSGIFPMADSRDDPDLFWVEPRERAIIPLDEFHCARSLARIIRQDRFRVTCNAAFDDVVEECAAPRETEGGGSWISDRIAASYGALHDAGHAHSLECWQQGRLVGGLYGVSFDSVFCGESMFSRENNASKVALAWLVAMLRHAGYRLLDCQFMTAHLASMGAVAIPQAHYLELVDQARGEARMTIPEAYSSLVGASAGSGVGVGDAVGAGRGAAAEGAEGATGFSSPGKLIAQSLIQTS
ncbi:leucyl/phenylalanyl-tRNA--protein transferase [Allopontixanthobacter sp.]|uniref:leucyl/phenylalanyl-tRNA--protein transferase n=1 Tax=Allopontixanthobacter sp. TaxID=2906452 RepID=UPI002ABB2A3D|nr:leucyl/phenylalanyl-tRNA--protein transferase [Allopontixanthobacter sp.]MDZ4307303.1 leucyl/phenylalanyl-tRNA--protein transferase [Allopontixanthobacter sp.]